MTKTPVEIVKGVIDLFSDESKWTQGDFAHGPEYDGEFEVVSAHEESAVCFCIMGAVDRIAGGSLFQNACNMRHRYPEEAVVADALIAEIGDEFPVNDVSAPYEPIAQWNDMDDRTIGDVRDLMQRTLARLEAGTA